MSDKMYEVENKETGNRIKVRDIPPELLGTVLVVLDERLQRWVAPNFLEPYKEEDFSNHILMNERRKAWLFMDKIYNKSDCQISFYLQELAEAYRLPTFDKDTWKKVIDAQMYPEELDEYNSL